MADVKASRTRDRLGPAATYAKPHKLVHVLRRVARADHVAARGRTWCLATATKPVAPPVLAGTLGDLTRSKPALIVENALLRQQLVVLRWCVKRPRCTASGRALLVLLASCIRAWWQNLLIVWPDTLLRWH